MHKEINLRYLFMKHFIAKSFGWTPDDMKHISADDFDGIVYIESMLNEKQAMEMKREQAKART